MPVVPSPTALRRALRRAADGKALDATEAEVLLSARGDDLRELMTSAARVRDAGLAVAGRPGVVTFSRKVFVPLTRLCRDRCHYCTFVSTPGRLTTPYLGPDEVLDVARRGAALGCKEALFTLGDHPEARWSAAREWLAASGYASTLDYLRAMSIRVLEETGLLPHLNPGVMSWEEMQRLRPVAASMGLMLETTSRRLYETPGGAHYGSPDKDPTVRLRVLEDAGRCAVPFTTGILVGIGETAAERVDGLFQIRRVARRYGGIQEVIVQNFRAKPDTSMRAAADLPLDEHLTAIAVSRLVLGPRLRIQAPPNLVDLEECRLLLAAGVDDWGGVSPLSPDHVNPERPWPAVDELGRISAECGFVLRERLAAHPPYLDEPWLDPRLRRHVAALRGPDGLARGPARPQGIPWQEPDGGWPPDRDGSPAGSRMKQPAGRPIGFDPAYGDWSELTVPDAARNRGSALPSVAPVNRLRPEYLAALAAAERDPAGLGDAQALELMDPLPGVEVDALAALADQVRRDEVGDDVTYVVNRNINFTNVCYTGCRFCAFAQRRTDAEAYTLSLDEVGERAAQAWAAGATEVCMQGGIHPDLPGTAYFDLIRAVKRRVPALHLHAFSPMEVVNGAARSGLSIKHWLAAAKEAGLDTLPGTAAEILDDDVRWLLTKGKLPSASWVEVIRTAHAQGIRSSATMMYGHVDTPEHWVAHLRLLARIQDDTGGFTEFVPLPFVHENTPLYLAGLARPGPTVLENRAVHAVARLLLHGRIRNIQCSWVKLGADGCGQVLRGGVNDLGGTLMEETISRMAGSRHGSSRSVRELVALAAAAGRPARERTTTYQTPPRPSRTRELEPSRLAPTH